MLYDCRTLADRDRGVQAAIDAVRRGDLVVFPTDTMYGLAADAFKPWAVTSLLDARGSGRRVPPQVLVGSRQTLDGLVYGLPQTARDLVEAFWPGALTIIVEHAPSLQWELGEEQDGTAAVRMPLHPVALEVLRETGPVAVSAAAKSGTPPPLTASDAREQLGYSVSVYLEAGPCPDSLPSTIVDVTGEHPQVLRAGAITLEKLRTVVPTVAGPEE